MGAQSLALFVGTMWLVVVLNYFSPEIDLRNYGIVPRTSDGLLGIPLAPFLHGDVEHMLANTVPLLVLGGLIVARSVKTFVAVTVVVTVVGGLGVWLFGRGDSVHIGASGLVFGYFGFLLLRAWFERTLISLAVAALVAVLYGGLIFGVLPGRPEVSWEGHLFGFAAGVLSAWWLRPKKNDRQR